MVGFVLNNQENPDPDKNRPYFFQSKFDARNGRKKIMILSG